MGHHGGVAGEEGHVSVHGSYMNHGKGPASMMQPVLPASMSVTWPRGYGGNIMGAVPHQPCAPTVMSMMNSNPVSLRASQQSQISADVSTAVGAGTCRCV